MPDILSQWTINKICTLQILRNNLVEYQPNKLQLFKSKILVFGDKMMILDIALVLVVKIVQKPQTSFYIKMLLFVTSTLNE